MRPTTVLVTGGARRLGAAIVRRLAADGYRVVIHVHHAREMAADLVHELALAGSVSGDLGALESLERIWADACDAAGAPIDGVVNSASSFQFDRPETIDAALAARLYAVNCVAPAMLTACLARQGRGGAVVNVLDQKVANLNPDFFSYTLSKVALEGATTMLAQAFAPAVRVNAVSPGLTLPSADQTPAEFAAASVKNLLEHAVGADQVAGAVAYLLGADSVTGQNLFVDCGQRFLKRDGDVMFEGRE